MWRKMSERNTTIRAPIVCSRVATLASQQRNAPAAEPRGDRGKVGRTVPLQNEIIGKKNQSHAGLQGKNSGVRTFGAERSKSHVGVDCGGEARGRKWCDRSTFC